MGLVGFTMLRQQFLLSTAVLTLSALVPVSSLAADTTVTGTVGQQTLAAPGDTITVTESGTVSTTGVGETGITGTNNHTITNDGTVQTTGAGGSHAIDVDSGSTITNNGTISTVSGSAHGINAEDGSNVISNTGTIGAAGAAIRLTDSANESSNNTVTNSGTLSSGGGIEYLGDNNTITNSGDITASSFYGIYVSGIGSVAGSNDSNTVTNTGTINAAQDGIYMDGDTNSVENSGAITATGRGINFDDDSDNNTVTNSGRITSSNDGINFGSTTGGSTNNVIVNSGTITTDNNGISFRGTGNDSNSITNSGTIRSKDHGIFMNDSDQSTITNTGTITSGDDSGIGIYVIGNQNVINHSGTITATKAGFEGIYIAGGTQNVINASGKIITNSGSVIEVTTNNNTVNINENSFFAGDINLSGSSNTVNINPGQSHSILWQLTGASDDTINFVGNVPVFYNSTSGLVATYDPTIFAGSFNSLGDLTGNISGLIGTRLASGFAAGEDADGQVLGYADQTIEGKEAFDDLIATHNGSYARTTGFWVSGFGSFADYEGRGSSLDQDVTQGGIAAGYDTAFGEGWSLGILAGYNWASVDADSDTTSSFEQDTDGGFAALYGRKRFGDAFLAAALSGGFQSNDYQRTVNSSAASTGLVTANASYDSWWFAPELRAGMDFATAGGVILTTSALVRYTHQSADGYTESGSTASALASVDDSKLGILDTRLQLAAAKKIGGITLTGHAGWQHRASAGDDDVRVTLVGQSLDVGYDANTGHSGFAGIGASAQLSDSLKLDLSAEALRGQDSLSGSGKLKLTFTF